MAATDQDTIAFLTESNPKPLSRIPEEGWKRGDGFSSVKFPAVFPELPAPLKRIYVSVRDLNKSEKTSASMSAADEGLDRRPKSALEVGLRF